MPRRAAPIGGAKAENARHYIVHVVLVTIINLFINPYVEIIEAGAPLSAAIAVWLRPFFVAVKSSCLQHKHLQSFFPELLGCDGSASTGPDYDNVRVIQFRNPLCP
ncbi:hypothetical protein D3C73_683140 [compost metagenome]